MPKWIVLMVALMIPPLQSAPAQSSAPSSPISPSGPVEVVVPIAHQAQPGDYVTLNFIVRGEGEYDLAIDGGPDWVPVTRSRKLLLEGDTLVPVTFRVPAQAPVGPSPALSLKVMRGGQVISSAETRIQVLPRARLSIRGPAELTGISSQRVSYQVQVTNLGNQADTLQLRATNVDGRPQLSEQAVYLQPGESRAVGVTFQPGEVSPGYLYIAFLEVTSKNDPNIIGRTRTSILFNPARLAGIRKDNMPQLIFGVRAGVEGGVVWTPDGSKTYLSYGLQPSLGGQLSDYTKGTATLSGLDGNQDRWIPSGLSFGLRLEARNWNLAATLGQNGGAAQASFYRGAWTYSPRVSYLASAQGQRLLSGGLGVSGPVLGGMLETDASSNLYTDTAGSSRNDVLNTRYTRNINDRASLMLGAIAAGQSAGGEYLTTGLGYEQITYDTDTFDVTQSYTGTLSGLHTFGLSGGLRSLQPFGVRGAVVVQYQPRGVTYSGSGVLSYSARNGFGLSVGGRYQNSTIPDSLPFWSVSGGLRSPRLVFRNTVLNASALYTLATDQEQPGQYGQTLIANAALSSGPLSANASGTWLRDPQADGSTYEKLKLGLSGNLLFNQARDTLSAGYEYERQQGSAQSVSSALLGSWNHQWNPRLSSQLDYRRAWLTSPAGNTTPESLGLGLGLQDLLISGLNLRMGYTVTAPNGLFNGNLTSGARIGLNYNTAWAVNTPPAVVKFFGGRKGGEVRGVLYRDDNFNSQRDPGEAGLPGVTVEIGGERTTSGPDGTYSLRVPVGQYDPKYPSGLPATLEALSGDGVNVKENSSNILNVPFAPVVHSEVLAYHDENRNGQRDPDEGVLPYVTVIFSGPVTRIAQADSRGYARQATLPPGHYSVTLDATQLPERFTPTSGGAQLDLQSGQTPATVELGAAAPARQAVTTYTASDIALIGSVTPNTSVPGGTLHVVVRVQNASSVKLEAFGQQYTPALQNGRVEQDLTVPNNLAAGSYDITVTAQGPNGQKTTTLKVLLMTPTGAGSKP